MPKTCTGSKRTKSQHKVPPLTSKLFQLTHSGRRHVSLLQYTDMSSTLQGKPRAQGLLANTNQTPCISVCCFFGLLVLVAFVFGGVLFTLILEKEKEHEVRWRGRSSGKRQDVNQNTLYKNV